MSWWLVERARTKSLLPTYFEEEDDGCCLVPSTVDGARWSKKASEGHSLALLLDLPAEIFLGGPAYSIKATNRETT